MPISGSLFVTKINNFFAGKLQGKTAASSLAVYSSQDPYYNGIGSFVRNPNCWLNGVKNISCFSPAQMSGASWWQRAGTLITPRHVLFAKHFTTSVLSPDGTPLIFVTDDGTTVRRNIIQYALHSAADIAVALLSQEVPSSIKIAKVLPSNYSSYFTFSASQPIYAVGLDQEEKALVKMMQNPASVNESTPSHQFQSFNESIIVGDSGNPLFLIIDNELVVLTTWYYGGAFAGGPGLPAYSADVNQMIESLSPGQGYSLTTIDLASAYENMQKVYFNGDFATEWSTLSRWWQDSSLTVPAVSLPISTDTPVVSWGSTGYSPLASAGVCGVL